MTTASWVIREKDTGEVICETFNSRFVSALNTAKYEAVPISAYLSHLHHQIAALESHANCRHYGTSHCFGCGTRLD